MGTKQTKKTGKKPVSKSQRSAPPKRAKSLAVKGKRPAASARPRPAAKPAKATPPPARKPALRPDRNAKVVLEKPKPKPRPAGALTAYEAGLKLMYSEQYGKAIKAFHDLQEAYPDEPEIQASAKAFLVACEKKQNEKSRLVFRGADDYYNIGIAEMNRGELETALNHLQHALKLAPRAEHVLYAMAAANALHGNKDQALSYLKQSIHHRPENRFQAARDADFAVLAEEPGFRELLSPSEK